MKISRISFLVEKKKKKMRIETVEIAEENYP
jgi:hypothetical protein